MKFSAQSSIQFPVRDAKIQHSCKENRITKLQNYTVVEIRASGIQEYVRITSTAAPRTSSGLKNPASPDEVVRGLPFHIIADFCI